MRYVMLAVLLACATSIAIPRPRGGTKRLSLVHNANKM